MGGIVVWIGIVGAIMLVMCFILVTISANRWGAGPNAKQRGEEKLEAVTIGTIVTLLIAGIILFVTGFFI